MISEERLFYISVPSSEGCVLNVWRLTMQECKIKKNARIQGLFYLFAGINSLIAALLSGGDKGLLYIGGALAFAALAVAMDIRKSNNSNGAVWETMGVHLFLTGFVLLASFHWAIVVLYFLELILCVYIWRKKK